LAILVSPIYTFILSRTFILTILIFFLLCRDNVPTIELATWSAEARLFNGDDTAGPVPTFFSDEMEAAKEAMMDNPRRVHQDLQRLMKMFIMPETVSLEEAIAIVKKPR
jgi:hypothetical protein